MIQLTQNQYLDSWQRSWADLLFLRLPGVLISGATSACPPWATLKGDYMKGDPPRTSYQEQAQSVSHVPQVQAQVPDPPRVQKTKLALGATAFPFAQWPSSRYTHQPLEGHDPVLRLEIGLK